MLGQELLQRLIVRQRLFLCERLRTRDSERRPGSNNAELPLRLLDNTF